MNKGLAVIEHAPYASINKIWLTVPEYLLLYVIIISLFYFFYDKKSWLLKLNLCCILLFCVIISIKRIDQSQSNTIAWLNLKKHTGLVFKNGNEAIVLTDIKSTDKIFQYSIQPYLDSCQVSNILVYDINEDINTPILVKKAGLVQFFNNRIFIFEGQLSDKQLVPKIKANYIFINGRADSTLNIINSNFECKTLIINGNISDNTTEKIEEQAKLAGIYCKILKRNNSLISASN